MELPAVPLLCDLDGTLIDSTASVAAAFRWWAGFRGLSADVVLRIPFGRTSADAAAALAPHLDSLQEGRLLDARQAQDTSGVVALEGARELLARRRDLVIVTSCSRALAEARLRAAGLPMWPALVTSESCTRGKPDPEPYLEGARMLGARPRDCVVLEDAPPGVESALRAGMRVIGLLTTHTAQQLGGATRLIASLLELPEALSAMGLRSACPRDPHDPSLSLPVSSSSQATNARTCGLPLPSADSSRK